MIKPHYKRILVALSGGIDSAISLHLLLSKYTNIHFEAVYMTTWSDDSSNYCPNNRLVFDSPLASIHKTLDLIKKQRGLSIPLHRVDFSKDYWLDVFSPSLLRYTQNDTPNPDILCNKYIKLGALLTYGKRQGFDAIATGHYLRIEEEGDIYQARDVRKDQSYFMVGCEREQFRSVQCPLGDLLKSEVRALAAGLGWKHLLDRKEPMGLCMVEPSMDFSSFLSEYIQPRTWTLVDENGYVIGTANKFMTVGQAVLIGGLKERLYVGERITSHSDISFLLCLPRTHPKLWTRKLFVDNFNWISQPLCDASNLRCSIRSMDKQGTPCKVCTRDDIVEIELDEPAWAAAEGQWAVLYERVEQGVKCLGGGIINKTISIE